MRKLIGLMAVLGVFGVFLASTPVASASESQCSSSGMMCVWGGGEHTEFFEGPFSWWPASSTGCHNHSGNPNIISAWNRTGYVVRMGGQGNLQPGEKRIYGTPVTGEICWPA